MRIPTRFTKVDSSDRYDRLLKRFTVFFHDNDSVCKMYTFKTGKEAYTRYHFGVNSPKIRSVSIEVTTQTSSYIVTRYSSVRKYAPGEVLKSVRIYDCKRDKQLI